MPQRPLGQSGIRVSELGFGAWGIGGRTAGATSYGDTRDEVSLAALQRAVDSGVNFLDTAPAYGDGHSERLIGQILATRPRSAVVVATKTGLPAFGRSDLSPGGLRRGLEASLERLRTDHVDLLQLHGASLDDLTAQPQALATLRRLRDEGSTRALGVSLRAPADGLDVLRRLHGETRLDSLQTNLNLLDDRAVACGLLDLAARLGVGVIARTPLCFGFLGGAIAPEGPFPPGDHRAAWPLEQRRRWAGSARALTAVLSAAEPDTPAQLALRWCLSHPGVSSVIPGMLTAAEVDVNLAASRRGPLPRELLRQVEARRATLETLFTPPVRPGSGEAGATAV